MTAENGNGDSRGRTFLARVIASATAMIPIMTIVGAIALPYVKAEVRKDWEPALAVEKAERKAEIVEKTVDLQGRIQELRNDLRDIDRKLDRVIDRVPK